MTEEMRFTVKRISGVQESECADGAEDFLGKGDHKPAEQTQEALGALACVMALDGHAHLHNAPAEDNDADGLNRGKDEVGQIVDHGDRIGGGCKGGGGEHGDADRQHTPKAEKEFCVLRHSFFHSLSSNVDKRYRIS